MKVWALITTVVDPECYAEGADVRVSLFTTSDAAIRSGLDWYAEFTTDDADYPAPSKVSRQLSEDRYVEIEDARFELTIEVAEKVVN